jgi:hypothetical protein
LRIQQTDLVHQEYLSLRQAHQLLQSDRDQLEHCYKRASHEKQLLQQDLQKTKTALETLKQQHDALQRNVDVLEEKLKESVEKQHQLEVILVKLFKQKFLTNYIFNALGNC